MSEEMTFNFVPKILTVTALGTDPDRLVQQTGRDFLLEEIHRLQQEIAEKMKQMRNGVKLDGLIITDQALASMFIGYPYTFPRIISGGENTNQFHIGMSHIPMEFLYGQNQGMATNPDPNTRSRAIYRNEGKVWITGGSYAFNFRFNILEKEIQFTRVGPIPSSNSGFWDVSIPGPDHPHVEGGIPYPFSSEYYEQIERGRLFGARAEIDGEEYLPRLSINAEFQETDYCHPHVNGTSANFSSFCYGSNKFVDYIYRSTFKRTSDMIDFVRKMQLWTKSINLQDSYSTNLSPRLKFVLSGNEPAVEAARECGSSIVKHVMETKLHDLYHHFPQLRDLAKIGAGLFENINAYRESNPDNLCSTENAIHYGGPRLDNGVMTQPMLIDTDQIRFNILNRPPVSEPEQPLRDLSVGTYFLKDMIDHLPGIVELEDQFHNHYLAARNAVQELLDCDSRQACADLLVEAGESGAVGEGYLQRLGRLTYIQSIYFQIRSIRSFTERTTANRRDDGTPTGEYYCEYSDGTHIMNLAAAVLNIYQTLAGSVAMDFNNALRDHNSSPLYLVRSMYFDTYAAMTQAATFMHECAEFYDTGEEAVIPHSFSRFLNIQNFDEFFGTINCMYDHMMNGQGENPTRYVESINRLEPLQYDPTQPIGIPNTAQPDTAA